MANYFVMMHPNYALFPIEILIGCYCTHHQWGQWDATIRARCTANATTICWRVLREPIRCTKPRLTHVSWPASIRDRQKSSATKLSQIAHIYTYTKRLHTNITHITFHCISQPFFCREETSNCNKNLAISSELY